MRMSRREFMKGAGGIALGFGLASVLPGEGASRAAAANWAKGEEGEGLDNINRLKDVNGPLALGIIKVDDLAPDGWLKRIFTAGPGYYDYTQPLEGSSPWLISGVVIDASDDGANLVVNDSLNSTPHMRVKFPLNGVEVAADIPLWDMRNTTHAQAFSVWTDSSAALMPSFKANLPEKVWLLPNYARINDQVLAMVHGGEELVGPAWLGELDGANGQIVTPQLALLIVPACR